MRPELAIAQSLVIVDGSGPTVVAKSDDFLPAWETGASAACVRFGRRPAGVACQGAVFACPVGKAHVAVVQVADLPAAAAETVPLGFRFLVFVRATYEALGDPFAIADRFPPNWAARGSLPPLEWPPEPLPPRTVEDVTRVLKSGDMALLLGGAQSLIDGGRLVLESRQPNEGFVRGLWQLLPSRTRGDLWPASFAFSIDLGFHVAVVPEPPVPWPPGHLTEDQARDYPEGRYELAIQTAVESGNQSDLDTLLARRSSRDTLRLALYMLAAAVVLAVASKLFF